MMNSFLHLFLLPIFVVGLTLKSFTFGYRPYHSGEEDEDHCKNASSRYFGKPYERYGRSCCKEVLIGPSPDFSFYSYGYLNPARDCYKALGPDDDLPTKMWKETACIWKIKTNTTEEDFTFQTVVNYLTKDYSNSGGVQQLIRDANTECQDGDKAGEFHQKLQAYFNCFYGNEQKTCNNPTPEGVKQMNDAIFIVKNSTIQSSMTCSSMAGFWDEMRFCCAGKQTPDPWTQFYAGIFKHHQHPGPYITDDEMKELEVRWELERNCDKSISDIISADETNKMSYQTEASTETIPGKSKNGTAPNYDYDYHVSHHVYLDCFDACRMNPVLYTNDSSGPDVKFDFKKELDLYFPNEAIKLQKDLKEIALRNKNSFKVSDTTADKSEVKNYLTLEEIETQYSSLANTVMKIRYYCAYYEGIFKLISAAHYGYCISDEALIHRLDPDTPHLAHLWH